MTQDRFARWPAGTSARLLAEGIVFDHPDRILHAAVEDARRALVHGATPDAAIAPTSRQGVLRTLALLAAGAFEAARADISASGEGMARAFLFGRYHAWSGDAAGVSDSLADAVGSVERHPDSPTTPLIARDLLSLADAVGDGDAGQRLRRAMHGASPDAPVESWLFDERGVDAGAETLQRFTRGESGPAAAAWSRIAIDASGGTDRAPDPWILPLLAAGLLGADPDAARGRFRLRLHLPPAWESWGVRRIRMGDAVLDLSITRAAGHAGITLEQTEGMLPVTILLEPIVHADQVSARVDGRPATLTPRRVRDHLVVPVQLVLDQPRRLDLVMGPPGTGNGGK